MCLSSIKEIPHTKNEGIVFNRSLHFTQKNITMCAKKIICTTLYYALDKKLNILSEACFNIIYLFFFLFTRFVYWKNVPFWGESKVMKQVNIRITYNIENNVTAQTKKMIPWFRLYIYHFLFVFLHFLHLI